MSKNKTNADVAEKAVAKSQKKSGVERTPENVLKGIRGNLAANLAVPPADQKFLLNAYDTAFNSAVNLGVEVERLKAQVEATLCPDSTCRACGAPCDLRVDHEGQHHCINCGCRWTDDEE